MTSLSIKCPATARRIAHLCATGGSRNPWVSAMRLAESTLRQCGVAMPAVNTNDLCCLRNVRASEMYLTDCDARIFSVGDHYIAEINASHPESRKRFSVCHELGHTFFEERAGADENGASCDGYTYQSLLEERLCDFFAAEFLMPKLLFPRFASDCRPSFKSTRLLAHTFGVSALSVARRIIDLDLWPMASLVFRIAPGEKVKFGWYKGSRSFRLPVTVSTVMKQIACQSRSSGETVLLGPRDKAIAEYYSYTSHGQTCISALLFYQGHLSSKAAPV